MWYCVGFVGHVQFCHPYLHRSNNQTHYHHNWSNNQEREQERDNPSLPLLIKQSNAPPPQLIKQSREKETTHDHHCQLLAIGLDLSLLLISTLIDLSLSLSKPISKPNELRESKEFKLRESLIWESVRGRERKMKFEFLVFVFKDL